MELQNYIRKANSFDYYGDFYNTLSSEEVVQFLELTGNKHSREKDLRLRVIWTLNDYQDAVCIDRYFELVNH